jgi:hypothetical protein
MKFSQLLILVCLFGCAGGTTTGNPITTVKIQDKQPLAWLKKNFNIIIPSAWATASDVKFCFKRLRFKTEETDAEGSNYDLTLGQVTLSSEITTLASLSIPPGNYRRVEFDLEKECDGVLGKKSLEFTNMYGSFSTDQKITIKFNGVYIVNADGTLTLDTDKILDAIELINDSAAIKTSLEAITGDF